jgi:hypothetical protein
MSSASRIHFLNRERSDDDDVDDKFQWKFHNNSCQNAGFIMMRTPKINLSHGPHALISAILGYCFPTSVNLDNLNNVKSDLSML